jgi:CheY-like chemotaxis protein
MSTVLIVDDEASVRFLLRMVFETAGYDVIEAPHGRAALERIDEARPALVVTDLMMPVMDGWELIARLRTNPATAAIPIIAASAQLGIEAHSADSDTLAADAILVKPFEPNELLETARTLCSTQA